MKTPLRTPLANIPTPVQQLTFNGCRFQIKRDDFTGFELSGNKVRKLEYLLYQARKEGADTVLTTGGEQSNHCRSTVAAAVSKGLKVKLFLWGKDSFKPDGNLFIDKFLGADISFLTKKEFGVAGKIMELEKEEMEAAGRKVFIIPEGGSSPLGIWGYINFLDELKKQTFIRNFKGILTAAGSGGTCAGLLVGSALYDVPLKVFAVNVLYSASELREKVFRLAYECIEQFKLPCKINEKNLEILDGYSEEGYKDITPEKVDVIHSFAGTSGIMLDPAYTGKAFYAYNDLFLSGKKKSDILFVHTGGFFGIFNKREEYLRKK